MVPGTVSVPGNIVRDTPDIFLRPPVRFARYVRPAPSRPRSREHRLSRLRGGGNAPHRLRLLAEEPPLHRLDKGEHYRADQAGSPGHGVDLEPDRVVAPAAAEMKHAHPLLTLPSRFENMCQWCTCIVQACGHHGKV